MFGDTITLPLSTGNVVCTKFSDSASSGSYRYRSATEEYLVHIRHSQTKAGMERHNVEISHTVYATSETEEEKHKVYIVDERVATNLSVVILDGLSDWLIASTNANAVKLVNGES